jgi:translation initiation factor IF-3
MEGTNISKELQINEEIRDKEVRVISDNGGQLGIMSAKDAFKLATEKGYDLVKIAPQAEPPVCKIMDYGKYKFEQIKKQKEARKNQKVVELKEIWLSMTIDIGDLNVKAKQAQKFLASGNKIKVSIRMRGRQNAHSDLGMEVMNKFYQLIENQAIIEKKPLLEGRNILMILAPKE